MTPPPGWRKDRQIARVMRDKAELTALTEKAEQKGSVPRAHTANLRGKEIIHTSEKS